MKKIALTVVLLLTSTISYADNWCTGEYFAEKRKSEYIHDAVVQTLNGWEIINNTSQSPFIVNTKSNKLKICFCVPPRSSTSDHEVLYISAFKDGPNILYNNMLHRSSFSPREWVFFNSNPDYYDFENRERRIILNTNNFTELFTDYHCNHPDPPMTDQNLDEDSKYIHLWHQQTMNISYDTVRIARCSVNSKMPKTPKKEYILRVTGSKSIPSWIPFVVELPNSGKVDIYTLFSNEETFYEYTLQRK